MILIYCKRMKKIYFVQCVKFTTKIIHFAKHTWRISHEPLKQHCTIYERIGIKLRTLWPTKTDLHYRFKRKNDKPRWIMCSMIFWTVLILFIWVGLARVWDEYKYGNWILVNNDFYSCIIWISKGPLPATLTVNHQP